MSVIPMPRGQNGTQVEVDRQPDPVKLKRAVVRCLGRLEQICACAERILDRPPHLSTLPDQGEIKNA
jgi:hypothetical protein